MNIHHLELFYYVAKWGGISEAVRHIPYGIQQPAVSAQILQLEDSLGVTLFQRRPFCLMPAGERLYRFILPFFEGLDSIAGELRGAAGSIRLGASEVVLRNHMPTVLRRVHAKFPKLKVHLREGAQPQFEKWLQDRELDLAMTMLESKPPPGVSARSILRLPLVLLLPAKCKIQSAEELWKRDKIEYDLLTLPPDEVITKLFMQGLAKRGVDWFPTMELTSLELIQIYVAEGYGIGLGAHVPQGKLRAGVRAIALHDFPAVDYGLLWHGKMSCATAAVAEELEKRAHEVVTAGDLAIRSSNAKSPKSKASKAIDSHGQTSL
jgi:DNA-binding transcriptional LysR family regulator